MIRWMAFPLALLLLGVIFYFALSAEDRAPRKSLDQAKTASAPIEKPKSGENHRMPIPHPKLNNPASRGPDTARPEMKNPAPNDQVTAFHFWDGLDDFLFEEYGPMIQKLTKHTTEFLSLSDAERMDLESRLERLKVLDDERYAKSQELSQWYTDQIKPLQQWIAEHWKEMDQYPEGKAY